MEQIHFFFSEPHLCLPPLISVGRGVERQAEAGDPLLPRTADFLEVVRTPFLPLKAVLFTTVEGEDETALGEAAYDWLLLLFRPKHSSEAWTFIGGLALNLYSRR